VTQPWDGKSDKLVAAFQKNSREQVHVRLKQFEGRPLIDIRIWYPDRETEEWKPSSKGIAISTELYDALVEAVHRVGDYLE
jgi:hypothetical protein